MSGYLRAVAMRLESDVPMVWAQILYRYKNVDLLDKRLNRRRAKTDKMSALLEQTFFTGLKAAICTNFVLLHWH
ncbi:hypothetical protein GP2143_05905 [marine gamma proteobacterium HTCC2143]|uniref:Uncharacterized protein n=1 Tax=marine gamma proteobacterium HTCC2143 TaxID=247633 RepID=A0YBN1_9GAMM|nr:hypothetical protein GP2143_05905 [marine gamma proteobacterium HTCC2143]